jgi:putative membrane protein
VIERDALLHYAYFLCIFALASLTRRRTLLHIDRFYGMVAGLVIASGVSLLVFGLKGAGFYLHNPVFWIKITLFVAIVLLFNSRDHRLSTWSRREEPDGNFGVGGCGVLENSSIALGASRGFRVYPALCGADGKRVMTRGAPI